MGNEALHVVQILTHVEFFSQGRVVCRDGGGGLEPGGAQIVSRQSCINHEAGPLLAEGGHVVDKGRPPRMEVRQVRVLGVSQLTTK